MTANRAHTPSTEHVRFIYSLDGADREYKAQEFDRWHQAEIAAAEQRGAIKALRDAATSLRDSKFANSVKPPHEKVQVPEADWLNNRADRLEGDDD